MSPRATLAPTGRFKGYARERRDGPHPPGIFTQVSNGKISLTFVRVQDL